MRKPLTEAVAERLRAEMGIKAIRPAEMARRLNVSHMYVARRMAGDTTLDLRDVERMAQVLEIPVSRLLAPALDAEAVAA